MKNSTLIFALIILSFLTACGQQNSFKDFDFDTGDYSLYFIDLTYLTGFERDECEFQKNNHFFKITDIEALKTIQSDYIKSTDKDVTPMQTKCYHGLQLIKDKKLEWGGMIDWGNNIFKCSTEKFEFEPKKIKNLEDYFIEISVFEFMIEDLETARSFYHSIIDDGAFLLNLQFLKENPLFLYNGTIEIQLSDFEPSRNENWNVVKEKLAKRLKIKGNFQLISYWNDTDSDKMIFSLLVESDIQEELPQDIEVIKSYQPRTNIEYTAVDIGSDRIEKIIKENNYTGITFNKK
jgi:hypothetical protein